MFRNFAEALFLFLTNRLPNNELQVKNKKKRAGETLFSGLD